MSVRWSTRLGAFLIASAAFGQTSPTGPRFDAAVISLATIAPGSLTPSMRPRVDPSRFELLGVTLPQLIRRAYRLEPYQNVTGPDWIKKTHFDVFATLPKGADKSQIPDMLQAALSDRLKLVLRRDSREQAVCLLTVGKGGAKLKEVPAEVTPGQTIPHSDARTAVSRQKSPDGYLTYSRLNGAVILDATKITMPDFAIVLGKEVKVPVFDRTGLRGYYEISLFVPGAALRSAPVRGDRDDSLALATPDVPGAPLAAEPEGVNIYRSIQRLGLKLEKSKATVEDLFVESAERNPVER